MKFTLSRILLIVFLLNACTGAPAPSGQEIAFAVKDGTFTYLRIDGTDPNGQWQTWEQSYETGRLVVQTDGYSWKGTAVLVFDVTNSDRESCVIDNIHEAPGSRMAAIIFTKGNGCSGEGGSARQFGSEQVLFEYMEARDGLKLVEVAGFAKSSTGCLRGIVGGFIKGLWGKIMVIVDCADAGLTAAVDTGRKVTDTITAINEILSKYNLQVTDKEVQEPVAPSAPDTHIDSQPADPSDNPDATFTFSSIDSAAFECQLDDSDFSTCNSPKLYNNLSDGSHTFNVRAKDTAGNIDPSPASYTWSVDTVMPTPSATPTETPTPTPEGAQGVVSAGQAYCRYGPGTAYLPSGDLFQGDRVRIDGRSYASIWLWVQPENLDRHCWAAASVFEIIGDVNAVEIVQHNLPFTSDASPVTGVTATREGNMVTIRWDRSDLAPNDLRGYLLELYTCQNGLFVWTALNPEENAITIQDDEECDPQSSGVIYVASVRGYSQPVQILPWP